MPSHTKPLLSPQQRHTHGSSSHPPSSSSVPLPGDSVIPSAAMVYSRTRLIHAPPSQVWPWVAQLGKSRGGWYLPRHIEACLPSHWLASRTVEPRWQTLAVGDRVDDYGFGETKEYFDVVEVDPPRALVYRSERYGTEFSWAILLRDVGGEGRQTEVTLRFRGRIRSRGWRRWVIVKGGDWMDWATTAPMLKGLAERAEGRAG